MLSVTLKDHISVLPTIDHLLLPYHPCNQVVSFWVSDTGLRSSLGPTFSNSPPPSNFGRRVVFTCAVQWPETTALPDNVPKIPYHVKPTNHKVSLTSGHRTTSSTRIVTSDSRLSCPVANHCHEHSLSCNALLYRDTPSIRFRNSCLAQHQ